MAKRKKQKRIFKDLIVLFIIIVLVIMSMLFMISRLLNQQEALSQLDKDKQYYAAQRQQLEKEKTELEKKLLKIDSDEYIENIAREKLNMYYPNEKLYLDASLVP